jgi:glutamine cyclotransferase
MFRSDSSSKSDAPSTAREAGGATVSARELSYEIVASYPHDEDAFLQGLIWHDGGFYESTGQYGKSTLRRVEFPSGKVLKKIDLSSDLFGEGLALVDNRLIQLTWTSRRGLIYDLETLKQIGEFNYRTEGWGLTHDGTNLIMSDGSSTLTYLDAQTFKPERQLPVRLNGGPIYNLNELEFIEGEIWANVWQSDMIVQIDPATGQVKSFLDLKGISENAGRAGGEDVLNGIAYDPDKKRIFVSGKLWPLIFEIRVNR